MFDYQAQQPDELSLERGDVVKVYRKMADGMSLTRYNRKPPIPGLFGANF